MAAQTTSAHDYRFHRHSVCGRHNTSEVIATSYSTRNMSFQRRRTTVRRATWLSLILWHMPMMVVVASLPSPARHTQRPIGHQLAWQRHMSFGQPTRIFREGSRCQCPRRQIERLFYQRRSNPDHHNDDDTNRTNHDHHSSFSTREMEVLHDRLQQLRVHVLEEDLRRPPNPDLSPHAFVTALLAALWHNADPRPDSGFRVLLRSSTVRWRRLLYASVGATPAATDPDVVASALGQAMSRPNNQFAILVGGSEWTTMASDENEKNDQPQHTGVSMTDSSRFQSYNMEQRPYCLSFPMEVLDYADGTCYVECCLRDSSTSALLAVLGWELEQRTTDGAWLVAALHWQDFRDQFRPGIGREEWVRICG